MGADTSIDWAKKSWNPIVGCSPASPGCTNCYAMSMAHRLTIIGLAGSMDENGYFVRGTGPLDHYFGTTIKPIKGRPHWTGKMNVAPDSVLVQPLTWRKPARIFVNSMSDLFHEAVPDSFIDRVFAVMAVAPQHDFLILTKRAARMRRYMTAMGTPTRIALAVRELPQVGPKPMVFSMGWPLPNVWPGVSVEDQLRANERIPELLATPAAVRWVSGEPLLGPIELRSLEAPSKVWPGDHHLGPGTECARQLDALSGATGWVGNRLTALELEDLEEPRRPKLDWVVVGGESGPKARPMHPDWVRTIIRDCKASGTPLFFKQWGRWKPVLDRDNDDPDWQAKYTTWGRSPRHRWLNLAGGHGFHGERVHVMAAVGKNAAGFEIDGQTYREFPR